MTKALIGIIGGSGIYDLPGLQDLREERVKTPWGAAIASRHQASITAPILMR
jgi:purine nucleoside phosphorylase